MHKLCFFAFVFSFLSFPLFSQKHKLVTAEDIAFAEGMQKAHQDASIAALSSNTEVSFDFDASSGQVVVLVEKEEVLISLKPGYVHHTVDFFDEESSIENVVVYDIKDKKVSIDRKEEMYSSEDIFYSDAQVSYFTLQFPTIGTRYRVRRTKKYADIRYFVSEYFSEMYPVKSMNIRYRVPTWLKADFKRMNFSGVEESESVDSKTGETTYTFKTENTEPKLTESYSKGPSHLYPHILFLYQGYDYKGKQSRGFKETKDLYTWYRSLVNLMNNEPAEVAGLAAELTKGKTSDEEKIKAVYYWVQENIRYIAFEDGIAGFKPDDCQAVYRKKYGDCKGMANLTKEMLISLGYDARLVWIGTRRLAYDYSTPSLGVDNHMICAVKLNDEFIFLDATEEFNELRHYAERIQGKEVMIEDGDAFIKLKVPVSTYDANTGAIRQTVKIEDEELTGKADLELEGESKAYFLYKINNLRQNYVDDALKTYLDNSDKSYSVSDIETTDITNRDGNIKIDYNFTWSKGVSAFGDEMYIDLDFEKEFKDWTFEDRVSDYLFNYKLHRVTEIVLEIPEGYAVSSLPEKMEKTHEDFFFKVDYSTEDGKIIYKKEIAVPHSEIKKEDFEVWNEFISELRKKYKEQIILSKA